MLINVEIDLCRLKNTPSSEVSDLFSEVARASKCGYHRIVMHPDLSTWVADNIFLSEGHKDQILDIGKIYTQTGGQPEEALTSLKIELNDESFIRKNENMVGQHWIASHKKFAEGMLLEQTKLLVENKIYDGGMYDIILKVEAKKQGIDRLDFDTDMGAGNSIVPLFSDLVEEKSIFKACIADRDFNVVEGNIGNQLMDIYTNLATDEFIGMLTIIPCNSVENFILFA